MSSWMKWLRGICSLEAKDSRILQGRAEDLVGISGLNLICVCIGHRLSPASSRKVNIVRGEYL